MSLDVAVVIPAYNSARFLAETIASVREQTRPAAELLVVDDGSSDGSAELVEKLGVRCIRRENGGPGAARNTGVRATESPLIAFLDADDLFLPQKLERQVSHMQANDCVACGSDALLLCAGRDAPGEERKNGPGGVPSRLGFAELLRGNPLICSNMVVRRSAFEAVGGFDEDRDLIATEDYDLWLRLLAKGGIDYIDEPLSVYRRGPWSLSDNVLFAKGIDKIMAKVLRSHGDSDELRRLSESRRGRVRIDAAYDLSRMGRGPEARELLAEARRIGSSGWAAGKIWLRSWLP